VIHAFAVPAFGIKQDAIPGFVRDTWFKAEKTGDFYGQCQELCGKEHAYMPIHVKVVTAPEYTAWVAAQQKLAAAKQDDPNKVWKLDEMIKRGESVYAKICAVCHTASGAGAGANKRLDGSEFVQDKDANKVVMQVLNGKGQMGAFKDQLKDTDIAAVTTYIKNSWSNKTGQLVQPSDVLAARK
jgi:cytochrome c oxidase subunit 2